MENPIKIDDLGVPLFLGNTHIPSHPCMVYLPAFLIKINQTVVLQVAWLRRRFGP